MTFEDICKRFSKQMNGKHTEIIDLMRNLIRFNPYYRMTAYEGI